MDSRVRGKGTSPLSFDRLSGDNGAASDRLRRCLQALHTQASSLHAIVAMDEGRAYAEAARLDEMSSAGHTCGPLHGMPVVVKDNINVAGLPTTNGSATHDGRAAATDAPVVRRLRMAGAVILGKTNMDQFALGATSSNSRFPRTVNAWQSDRIPGGSSSGSAVAIASGVAYGALGTDTGGSVRTPAAFNGVVGLRPTTGALSTSGVVPLSPVFDTIGPMGGSVEAVRQLFAGMAEPSLRGRATPLDRYPSRDAELPLQGLRIGIFERYFFDIASTGVAGLVWSAVDVFRQLGATVVDVDVSGVESTQEQLSNIMLRDAYETYQVEVESDGSQVLPSVRQRVLLGRQVTSRDYDAAVRDKNEWTSRVKEAFATVDIIAVPSTPAIAPLIDSHRDAVSEVLNVTQFTIPWSFAGVPAVSIPCGLDSDMPVGMQLIGPHGSDIAVLRISSVYEHHTLWRREFERLREKSVLNAFEPTMGSTS